MKHAHKLAQNDESLRLNSRPVFSIYDKPWYHNLGILSVSTKTNKNMCFCDSCQISSEASKCLYIFIILKQCNYINSYSYIGTVTQVTTSWMTVERKIWKETKADGLRHSAGWASSWLVFNFSMNICPSWNQCNLTYDNTTSSYCYSDSVSV